MKSSRAADLLKTFMLATLSLSLTQSCSNPAGNSNADSKVITSFVFSASQNASLAEDEIGQISGATIIVYLPFDTSVTNLNASFTTTGSSVTVSGIQQVSGQSAHDFTSPVVYVVKAEDGSSVSYTVTVGMRFSDDFNRNDAAVLGNGWTEVEPGDSPQSAASVSGNALNLQGGLAAGAPSTPVAVDVWQTLSLAGSLEIKLDLPSMDDVANNRILVALINNASDPTKNYFLGYLGGSLVIYRDSAVLLATVTATLDGTHLNSLVIDKTGTNLSVTITDHGTGEQWSTSVTDSTYGTFAQIMCRGGWYVGSTSLSVTADNFVVQSP